LPFRPVVRVSITDEHTKREAFVSQYVRGMVQHIACTQRDETDSVVVVSKFYAHRTYPSILEQDITVSNPSQKDAIVQFEQLGLTGDPQFKPQLKK